MYSLGDKVVISPSLDWPTGATGTIAIPPFAVTEQTGHWSNAVARREDRDGKQVTVYWVEFDSPQRDYDGDGPYLAGSVQESDLTLDKAVHGS